MSRVHGSAKMSAVSSTFLPSQSLIRCVDLTSRKSKPEDTQALVAKLTHTQPTGWCDCLPPRQSGHVDSSTYRGTGCQLSPPSESLSQGRAWQEAAISFTQLSFLQSTSQEKHLEPLSRAPNLQEANSKCMGRESLSQSKSPLSSELTPLADSTN